MIQQLFNFVMIAGIVQGFIFIIATSLTKRGRHKSVVYLNLVVLFLTLNNLQIVLVDNNFVEVNFFIRKMLIPWYMLILPSFYTFLMYYLQVENKIYSFVRVSVGFFLIEILVRFYSSNGHFYEKDCFLVAKYSQIEEIINAVYTIFLFIKAFLLLFQYSKLYQFILSFDNIKWLKNFMFMGGFVLLLWVVAIILNLDKVINPQLYIYYPMRLSCTILLYWIGYQGFFNYSILTERIKLRKEIQTVEPSKPIKIEENKDQNELDDKRFLLLKNHIESKKRYLDPSFSLENLSDETEISVNKLSQIINQKTDFNFSDYINQFRVEKSKKYLCSNKYSEYTIVAIGLECGFNSKSAFYTSFKKFTNKTPSEYKIENKK
jgi:AraC-like DNA-binding protein